MDIAGYSEEPESVRFSQSHRPRALEWTASIVRDPGRDLVAPRISLTIGSTACRSFPLCFRREPDGVATLRAPDAIGLRVIPADTDHGLVSQLEGGIVPFPWRFVFCVSKE